MLSVTNLRSGYGNTMIVQNFSLEVGPGEIVGLLGRNGVGKTTALKTIMGLLPAQVGSVIFDGVDLSQLPANERARTGLAYVPQGRLIFGSLSVEDNIRVGAVGAGVKDIGPAVQEMYDQFPVLYDKRRQPGRELSGGQQQILAFARALITNPKLILLDEPSEGIQPSIVSQIGELIKKLSVERNISVVLVEQNFDFATSVVSTVHLMEKGEVVYTDKSQAIRDDVAIQKKYLGL